MTPVYTLSIYCFVYHLLKPALLFSSSLLIWHPLGFLSISVFNSLWSYAVWCIQVQDCVYMVFLVNHHISHDVITFSSLITSFSPKPIVSDSYSYLSFFFFFFFWIVFVWYTFKSFYFEFWETLHFKFIFVKNNWLDF